MNAVIILANGSGQRFGSKKPKQFHTIQGKMVIEHVLKSVSRSKLNDKIIIVTNGNNKELYLDKITDYEFDVVDGGDTRNRSLGNAIEYIKNSYDCDKVIVCDAVRPMISGKLIDDYFEKLDSYSAVVTAQKITDSLGCFDIHQVDRERYYLMQSPEGFDFAVLSEYFDVDSPLTEVVQQFPEDKKIYLNFDFKNNLKLTYHDDLMMLDIMISKRAYVDFAKLFEVVTRLNDYLLSNYPSQTTRWISSLALVVPHLLERWEITDYEINESSHFGIILICESKKYGSCVLKIIPPFINRFEGEKQCYYSLSDQFMCKLYDCDEAQSALLLKCVEPKKAQGLAAQPEAFADLFTRVFANMREASELKSGEDVFPVYYELLNNKLSENKFEYRNSEIMSYVAKADNLYKECFSDDKLYLIHGDLHSYNMLYDDGRLVAVDPIGFLAPKEFETARFIGTELTDNMDSIPETLDRALEFAEQFAEKDRVLNALYIDTVFRLHNSISENSEYSLTDKWLTILKELDLRTAK